MKTVGIGKRSFGSALSAATIAISSAMLIIGCGKQPTTFSLLATGQSFKQAEAHVNNKIDMLWVVDNSGSMDPLQQNLVNNFSAFMNNFLSKGYDFQMAVTTSDAYLAAASYNNDPAFAKFRDGANGSHTGVFVINQNTPNALQTFMTNATQGSNGSGDERIFQSMVESLFSSQNAGFYRPGAFLAVIILSDEDDFSNYSRPEGVGTDHNYSQTGLLAVDDVISKLDQYTASTASNRYYNVSAITVKDSTCQQQHVKDAPSTIIGTRYMDIVNKTNGVLGSVCDPSYATALANIQQRIVELSTQFRLETQPNVSTIQVFVNGQVVPKGDVNGWSYIASSNSIQFHGTAVPPAGAAISVNYDPMGLQ